MSSSIRDYLHHLHSVYSNALNENAPRANVDSSLIKIPLHPHQQAVLYKMEDMEQRLNKGMEVEDECVYSNYGILGDSVGVGKSLMVLSHISRLSSSPPLKSHTTIRGSSTPHMFSLKIRPQPHVYPISLIVVPHTLFRQWADYIKKQTTIKNMCISRSSQLKEEKFVEKLQETNILLISNTLFKSVLSICHTNRIRLQRIFIDEADTIYLTSGYDLHEFTPFIWFITASWMNLMYMNVNLYLDKNVIDEMVQQPSSKYNYLQHHFLSKNSVLYGTYTYYIESMRVRSRSMLQDIITPFHILRSQLVVSCSDKFIKQSIILPQLIRRNIYCRAPISYQILQNMVSTTIQNRLHAGDTEGVMEELGIVGKDMKSIIEGVTATFRKELEKNIKLYAFKETLEYNTPAAKAAALLTLQQRIDQTKASIASMEERVRNFKQNMCPICYEEPDEYLVTPCCTNALCPKCLLLSVATNPQCPLCRAAIHPSKCTKLVSEENVIETGPKVEEPKKHEALLQIIKENPGGKFLVFSRYDNPFELIEGGLSSLDIKVRCLKGNKDVISSTLEAFDSGKLQCLLLNSQYAGSGLNITSATHVILLHAMTYEEEKQILGRAYRAGRKGPLTFIKLLHKGEEIYSEQEGAQEVAQEAAQEAP
jgi:SNF2 family DNA or RNA helicase